MRLALVILLSLTFFGPLRSAAQALTWAGVRHQVRTAFPDVRQLSTDSLALRLASSTPPVLLDVRAAEEFAVSHLAGAQRLDPSATDLARLLDLPLDAPLVTYCSVGYRSSAMAQRLQEAGFTNVANLEGSLFAWANEGRTVVRDGRPVRQVHPYDATWGLLLAAPLRATTPR